MTTGIKLRNLRIKKKLSQEELAEKIGVSQVTIGNWEQGKSIKHENVKKLAEILDVPFDYLLEEKQINISQNNTENAANNVAGFEIIIKTPNHIVDSLFSRIDRLIELLEKK